MLSRHLEDHHTSAGGSDANGLGRCLEGYHSLWGLHLGGDAFGGKRLTKCLGLR